ncbi:kinase-like domain-containing protein, partial [Rhodocollybia butyracea]
MSQELAQGVAHLHSLGVAHLDLRPFNIGFDQDYSLRIFDFGLSETVSSEDDLITGARGHPNYMAPEQSLDGPYRPLLADHWACGMI